MSRGTGSRIRERRLGVIAQEVQRVLPELVVGDAEPDAMLGVEYDGLIPVLIEGVKELRRQVAELLAENVRLTERVSSLEAGYRSSPSR